MDFEKILSVFGKSGVVSCESYGSGHINDTYKVETLEEGRKHRYVLQKMNTKVFPRVDILMDNATKVCRYLRGIIEQRGGDPCRETLHFYPTLKGEPYYVDEAGGCWRLEDLVEGAVSYDLATTPEMFQSTGYAFGQFLADLSGFPAEELGEVIPNFHNTRVRFATFEKEVAEDRSGRLATCREEVAFCLERKALAESLVTKLEAGVLPVRVTHNDTKINNILMDEATGKPICIIDLDTIMPGACAYDFGDSIRFGASSAKEDEQDLEKVYMSLELFEAFTQGYLEAVGASLTEEEAKSLAIGSMVITFETGIRFLGDYLNGDVYFKVAREGHNLDRARTQLKLVADMESKLPEMEAIVEKYYRLAQAKHA